MAKKQQLWRLTPCTVPFVSASSSFQKSERFKLHSIYHKDDVNKPKPVFNDIEKPELLLQQFRRQIEQAGSDRFKKRNIYAKRSADKNVRAESESNRRSNRTPSPDKMITDKLYKLSSRQDWHYDRYGIRSNLAAKQNEQSIKSDIKSQIQSQMNKTKTSRASFLTSSRRIDLSRPLNFYPAPNSYRHVDFLSQRKYIPSPGRMSARLSKESAQKDTI